MARQSPTTKLCFLCNEETYSSETRLLTSTIPQSSTTPLLKIEQLLEEHCMIVVGQDDELCERCHNMLLEFDKLEVALKGFLTIKFNLGNFHYLSEDVESAECVEECAANVIIIDAPLESESFDLISNDTDEFSVDIPTNQESSTVSLLIPEQPVTKSNKLRKQKSLKHLTEALGQESFEQLGQVVEQESLEHVAEALEQESLEHVEEVFEHPEMSRKRCIPSRRPHKCPKCASVLSTKWGLDKHMKKHNSVPSKCDLCDTTFPDFILCRQHVHKVHLKNIFYQRTSTKPVTQRKTAGSNNKSTNARKQVRKRVFKCTKCERQFSISYQLEHHLLRHKSAPAKCQICQEMFSDSFLWRKHVRLVHGSQKEPTAASNQPSCQYPCTICTRVLVSRSNLKRHIMTCHESEAERTAQSYQPRRQYPCTICGRVLATSFSLKGHLTRHKERIEPVKCPVCDENLPSKRLLMKHTEEVHPLEWIEALKEKCKYKCPKCSLVLCNKASLRRHTVSHESGPSTCRVCKLVLPDRLFLQQHVNNVHLQGVEPMPLTDSNGGPANVVPFYRKYKCPKCDRILANRSSIKTHLAKHKSQPVDCKICLKTLDDKLCLQQHMLKVHQQITGCGLTNEEKRLTAQALLEAESGDVKLPGHVKATRKYRHKCPKCVTRFSVIRDLSLHMKLHETGPVECECCPETLADQLLFQHHMQMEHLQDFRCAECQAVMPTKAILVRHLKEHEPEDARCQKHLCSVCGMELSTLYSMKCHERVHERAYSRIICTECSERFLSQSLLHRHEVQAHGKPERVRPKRRCVPCNQIFQNSWNLKQHKERCLASQASRAI